MWCHLTKDKQDQAKCSPTWHLISLSSQLECSERGAGTRGQTANPLLSGGETIGVILKSRGFWHWTTGFRAQTWQLGHWIQVLIASSFSSVKCEFTSYFTSQGQFWNYRSHVSWVSKKKSLTHTRSIWLRWVMAFAIMMSHKLISVLAFYRAWGSITLFPPRDLFSSFLRTNGISTSPSCFYCAKYAYHEIFLLKKF